MFTSNSIFRLEELTYKANGTRNIQRFVRLLKRLSNVTRLKLPTIEKIRKCELCGADISDRKGSRLKYCLECSKIRSREAGREASRNYCRRKAGIPLDKPVGRYKYSDFERATLLKYLMDNPEYSQVKAAKIFGASSAIIYQWLNRYTTKWVNDTLEMGMFLIIKNFQNVLVLGRLGFQRIGQKKI